MLAGFAALVSGTLMKDRAFPFLQPDHIISAGRIVSTEEFAALAARFFYIAGAVLIIVGVAMLVIHLRRGKPRI